MKYKNIKTGAIIDSSSKITGSAWQLIDEFKREVENTEQEYIEEEINLEEMTNKELEELAKEHGIELTTEDKKNKKTRIEAIAKAFN